MKENTEAVVVSTRYFFNNEELFVSEEDKKNRILKLLFSMPLQNTL